MAPYLSKNYRFKPKSRLQSLKEAGKFLGLSILAVMLVMFLLGWVAYSFQTQESARLNNLQNQVAIKSNF